MLILWIILHVNAGLWTLIYSLPTTILHVNAGLLALIYRLPTTILHVNAGLLALIYRLPTTILHVNAGLLALIYMYIQFTYYYLTYQCWADGSEINRVYLLPCYISMLC